MACEKAKNKVTKAKKKLKQLKQADASAQAIKKSKAKLRKAKDAARDACNANEDKPVLFDITSVNGRFDATVVNDDGGACSTTTDAHWTTSLAPGNGPASLEVYFRDNQGRPVYIFSPAGRGIDTLERGTGVATRTCSSPPPGSNGTSSCTFNANRPNDIQVVSNPEAGRDPMTLEWFFGYSSFQYALPASGGSCTYSGPFPSLFGGEVVSPGLFVSSLNDGENLLEPPGTTTVPVSTFGQNVTLDFSGSAGNSFPDGSLEASWQMTVTLSRR